MYQRVFFGTVDNPSNLNLKDLSKREWAFLVPIVIFIVWIGIHPSTFTNISENSTRKLVNKIENVKFGITPYPELLNKSNLKTNSNQINNNKIGK
jgi:NADH-quinone oxidoreductase subunit M